MPPPRPLRTARDSFPSCSSSLSNAPCGTRCRNVQTLRRLHDTRLEPIRGAVGLVPIYGVPVHPLVEGCTSSHAHLCRHLLCLLHRLAKLSRDERPDGSQRAFARSEKPLLSASLQDGLRFFHPPLPATPSTSLTIGFPWREDDRFTPFRARTHLEGLGSACLPVAHHLRQGMRESLHLTTCLLAQAYCVQHLWLVGSDDIYQRFTCVSHTLRP